MSKSTQLKDGLASYLLKVKSMLGSGQGPSLLHRLGLIELRGKCGLEENLVGILKLPPQLQVPHQQN